MAALSSTFGMNAKGSDPLKDLEADIDPAANDPTYVRPQIDLMQAAVRQVAQPQQESSNQPSAEVAKAMQQREQLTSKAPGGMGAALSDGSSAKAGAERQKTAQQKATHVATEVAKLDKKIAGGEPAQPSLGNKFAGAAMGQVMNMGVAAGATMAAGPAAGAAVMAIGAVYDVAAVFSGRSGGGSSFKSSADPQSWGYVSQASAQPSVTMSFAQNMMNIPGQRRIDPAGVNLVSEALKDITTAPKLEYSPAFVQIAGAFKNGGKIREEQRDSTYDKDTDLDIKSVKPNPGVLVPQLPRPAIA